MPLGRDLQLAADEASARGEPYMAIRTTTGGKKVYAVGDRARVIETPPTGQARQDSPDWVSEMDQYAGVDGEVTRIIGDDIYEVTFYDGADNWYYCAAWLTPALPDLPDPAAVFEEPDPVPAEPDAKRRRVSNALFAVLDSVLKLEGDFEYEYGYNRELIEELAQAKQETAAAKLRVVELERAEQFERQSHVDTIQRRKAQVADLEAQLRTARGPRRLLKFLAVSGWVAAVLSGGVLAFEKISATPVDVAVMQAIMPLHDATSEEASQ